jgi:hypothetical protein
LKQQCSNISSEENTRNQTENSAQRDENCDRRPSYAMLKVYKCTTTRRPCRDRSRARLPVCETRHTTDLTRLVVEMSGPWPPARNATSRSLRASRSRWPGPRPASSIRVLPLERRERGGHWPERITDGQYPPPATPHLRPGLRAPADGASRAAARCQTRMQATLSYCSRDRPAHAAARL